MLDRMEVWQGTRAQPVSLEDVEAWVLEAVRYYGGARVVADPWQAVGTAQRLRSNGVEVEEFAFTATSTGRLAAALFNAIRDRALALPPDEELLDELAHVRLRESSPGVFRLDHDSGRHDDRAVCLALAVTTLLQDEVSGPVFVSYGVPPRGTTLGDIAYERGEISAGYDPDSYAAEDAAEGRGGGIFSDSWTSPLDDDGW